MRKRLFMVVIATSMMISFSGCSNVKSNRVETSVSNIEVKESKDIKQETEDSISKYLEMLGVESKDGNVIATEDFLNNMDSVFIMGRTGTITCSMTDVSKTQIRIVGWVDNSKSTRDEFNEFVDSMKDYFSEDGDIRNYDNVSEETYVWHDYSCSAWATCWYDTDTIKMNWYYDESIGKTDTTDKAESSDKVYGSDNTVTDYQGTLIGSEDIVIASSKDDLEDYVTYMTQKDIDSVNAMISDGRIAYADKGTKVNIMEHKLTMTKVHILEGTYKGNEVWVLMEAVKEK